MKLFPRSNEQILFKNHLIPYPNVSKWDYEVAMKLVTEEQIHEWELEDCSLQAQLDNVSPLLLFDYLHNKHILRTTDGGGDYKYTPK